MLEFDSPDKPIEDHEYPDEYEPDDDWRDDADLLACPNCHAEIADDSVRCAVCGEYVTFGTSVWDGNSRWLVFLGLLGIVATLMAVLLL